MGMAGAFPAQRMLDLVVELGSVGMTQAGAGEGELNPALPSWDREASMGGGKNPGVRGIKTWGEGCRAGSGHGAMGSPGWNPPPGPRCDLRLLVLYPCSVIPQGQALCLCLPGPACFPESWVGVGGVGLPQRGWRRVSIAQWDADIPSILTQAWVPTQGLPARIPGTAPPSRHQAIAEPPS